MTDAISSAIQITLHGLAQRARVTDNNIANVETPGFLASRSDFETNLKAALDGHGGTHLEPITTTSLAPTRTDGNNVDIDNETVTAIDTNLRYQAMIEAMNVKFRLLRTAVGTQS